MAKRKTNAVVAKVKARCVFCKHENEYGPGDVKAGEHPMCPKCGGPMATVGAVTRPARRS